MRSGREAPGPQSSRKAATRASGGRMRAGEVNGASTPRDAAMRRCRAGVGRGFAGSGGEKGVCVVGADQSCGPNV
jgi:hypothetical protein